MRVSLLSVTLVVAACHGASPQPESPPARRAAAWDSSTARRICDSPDSVIAGKKECVLRDQGVRRERRPPSPERRP